VFYNKLKAFMLAIYVLPRIILYLTSAMICLTAGCVRGEWMEWIRQTSWFPLL